MRTVLIFLVFAIGLIPAPAEADDLSKLQAQFHRPGSVPYPAFNPPSEAKVRLGKVLFFDPRLSGSNSFACATCHNPDLGWEDGQQRSVGETGEPLARHTPTILNLAWGRRFGWDGRIPTLEGFVLGPIANAKEMNQDLGALMAELTAVAGYRLLFAEAFPAQAPSIDHVSLAIAAFERTVVSAPAPFDAWIEGNREAIPAAAKAGFRLFTGKAGCAQCHAGWNFTDGKFHDIGLASPDTGRGGLDGEDRKWRHAFKTPSLRQIGDRAPFMHDGSMADLGSVIDHYDGKFRHRPTLAKEIKRLSLSAHEKFNLRAFLDTLTAEGEPVSAAPIPD